MCEAKELSCNECIHQEVCLRWADMFKVNSRLISRCDLLEPRSKYVELIPSKWIKHSPDAEVMKAFHDAGVGKGMSENSVFWTCEHCGGWGTPVQTYCPNCGSRMKPFV